MYHTIQDFDILYFVAEFGDDIFSIDTSVLFCKLCEYKVNSNKIINAT